MIKLKREDYDDCSGIYLLYYNNTIVYIGMSTCSILNRIFGGGRDPGHISNKIFNKIHILNMDSSSAREISIKEFELIQEHCPYYNEIYKWDSTKMTDDILEIKDIERYISMQLIMNYHESVLNVCS